MVNADSLYMEMAKTSLHLLREQNPTIPVTVFLVDDHRFRQPDDFRDFCKTLRVDIRSYPNAASDYFQDNKVCLAACRGEYVLLLDADTFVFADVAALFEKYAGYDVVACTNDWVWHLGYQRGFIPGDPRPLNSGIVLCSSRFLHSWTQRIPMLHEALKKGALFPELSSWLYEVSASAYNREEFALTICSAEPVFRAGVFGEHDCKLLKYKRLQADLENFRACTKIFHSYSQHWRRCVSHL